jgi:xanthine dehydrogenase/oxidase
VDFRVDLLHPDERLDAVTAKAEYGAVKNSRTSGEPCLVLAVSGYLAIKRAVLAARTQTESWPRLDLPATVERVQTLCEVRPEHLTL